MKSLRTIADAMGLSSPNEVSKMLRGIRLPADKPQLNSLVHAMGGGDQDVERSQGLYEKATRERTGRNDKAAGARARWRSTSGWLEQVRDIAPADGLMDREVELAELAEFCAGDEPYAWWQADAWAGKSALLSTFVLDPPDKVDAVGFFLAPHAADAGAFTDALLEQLTALVEEAGTAPPGFVARDAYRRRLLRNAAAQCRSGGRSLILVVDGLDEDKGARPGSGLPSIASLLPKTPAEGLKVIIASRPDPAVVADLGLDHPLRHCRVRRLTVSQYATGLERLARRELNELLAGDPVHRELLGLLTASGSSLTLAELEELTGRARFEIDQPLDGAFGRTLAYRADNTTIEPRRVLTFAHETLRAEAVDRFGRHRLDRHREILHTWADLHRSRRWSDTTPGYLVRGYPQLLVATADVPRLVALALDRERHDRLALMTGGAAAAFAEIQAALDLVRREDRRNLPALARLAVHRFDLEHRAPDIPVGLPAVWAELGHFVKAESLARSMTDPVGRSWALREVAAVLASVGEQERAEAVTHSITIRAGGEHVLTRRDEGLFAPGGSAPVSVLPRPAGQPEAVADAAPERDDRALGLFVLCDLLDQNTPEKQWGDELGREAELVQSSVAALTAVRQRVAQVVGPVGSGRGDLAMQLEEAEAEAGSIAAEDERVQALSAVLDACTRTGDLDRAMLLADALRATAGALKAPGCPCADAMDSLLARHRIGIRSRDGLRRAAQAADQAAALTRAATYNAQALALAALAHALAVDGRPGDASRVAGEAETTSNWATPPARRARTFVLLAWTYALVGDRQRALQAAERAETTARLVTQPDHVADVMIALAQALANVGYEEQAARAAIVAVRLTAVMAGSGGDPVPRAQALAAVGQMLSDAAWLSEAGQVIANAEAVATLIADPLGQAEALIALVRVLDSAGLSADAARLADQAVSQAYLFARAAQRSHHMQAQLLRNLAEALDSAGRPTQAKRIAAIISHLPSRMMALEQLERAPHRPRTGTADTLKPVASTAPQFRRLAQRAYDLAVHGEHEQAADLAAELLATGPWTSAVPTLAIVNREALRAAAADLLDSLDQAPL